MKKGLLSLLAVALTVVSCQNYDDQFQSLTDQITTLSGTVAGLTAITDQVTALQQLVNGLATAESLANLAGVVNTVSTGVDANADAIAAAAATASATAAATAAGTASATAAATAAGTAATAAGDAVADVAAQVVSVQASLTAILADLENVATAADLATISATLAIVQADVKEILAGSAVINQDVVITNSATLEYAETLIGTESDDPNVIINGTVRIDTSSFSSTITTDQLSAVNAVAAKIATILGDGVGVGDEGLEVKSSTALTFTNLTFIDDDYKIDGADQDDAALRTVSGNLNINHGGVAAGINYSQLTSIGAGVTIAAADTATATSVDFSGVIITGSINSGVLSLPGAITIDLGSNAFNSLTAAKATSIVSTQEAALTSLTIVAGNGGTVTVNSLEDVTGPVALTGSATTTFFLNGLETAGSITVTNSQNAHFTSLTDGGAIDITADTAVNLPALAASSGATDIDADNVILTGLVSITHTFDLNAVATLDAAALVSVENTLTIDNGPINLPTAQFTGSGLLSTTATTVTVGGSDDASLDNVAVASVDYLTIAAQTSTVTLAAAAANLLALDITTADSTGSTIDLTVPSAAAGLLELTSTGFDVVTVDTSNIVTMTTAGTTRNVVLEDNAALVSLSLGHVYDSSYTDAQVVNIINNDLLTSVDLTSVARLEAAEITDNAVLATITAPSGSDPLTPGATTNFTINANALVATYTNSVAAVQDGINNSPYEQASIEQPSLLTWKTYFAAIAVTNTVTYDLDYDLDGAGVTADFDTDSGLDTTNNAVPSFDGTIDTAAELAIIN